MQTPLYKRGMYPNIEREKQSPSHRKRWVPSPFPLPTGERIKMRGREKQPSHMERDTKKNAR